MSLAYSRGGVSALGFALVTVAVSGAAHVALPAVLIDVSPEKPPEITREETGIQGAILFDLSDIVATPSEAGEDSVEIAQAEEAPTVTESPETVDPAKAADEPILNQIPYKVEDDELKFAITSPDPTDETEERARETAAEFQEEQVEQASSLGATAADASQASVSGVTSETTAEKAQASSEGLTADQMQEITDWQKAVVLRIAKAKLYPSAARKKGVEGEVRVKFTIDRYGTVLAREVTDSSGSALLDQAALKVFDDVGKLPTPPSHLTGDDFSLVIPLNYRIKKG